MSELSAHFAMQIERRLQEELDYHGDKLSVEINALWSGYLTCAYEHSIINFDTYKNLMKKLPLLEGDPVYYLSYGRIVDDN